MTNFILEADTIARQNNIYTPPEKQTILFLNTIWSVMPDNQMVGLQAKTDKHHIPYWFYMQALRKNKIDGALQWATTLNKQGANIFYNCTSRKESVRNRFGAKGTYDELVYASFVWTDIDCFIDGTTITQAYDVLMTFEMIPSLIIFSGGGLQAVWVFNELWDISSEAKAREFKEWQINFLKPRFAQHNFKFDSAINDPTRELRLPGFRNTKKNRNNAVARIIYGL